MTSRRPQTAYIPGQNIPRPEAPAVPQSPLTPRDILPRTAALNPLYDMKAPNFATAQNIELAYQYGVLRDGKHVTIPRPSNTMELNREAHKVTQDPPPSFQPPPTPAPPPKAEPAPAPVQEKGPSIVEKERATEEEVKEPTEAYSKEPPIMGATDLVELRERVSETVLNSPAQRKIVEQRLKGSFDYSDFLLDRPIQQTVVIVPGGLEITYESLPYGVELQLKRMIAEEAEGPVFNEHLLDKFFLLGLAASVFAINGDPLPGYRDPDGKFNPTRLEAKLAWLLRRPVAFIAMLSVQFIWFNDRMNRALEAIDPKAG